VLGIPLITVAGAIFAVYLGYLLYSWVTVSAYGVNNPISAIYLSAQFVLAIVVYGISRYVRRRQGIRLELIHKSIPVE
jgi:high-affinity Fe2+/Pb2+ permease